MTLPVGVRDAAGAAKTTSQSATQDWVRALELTAHMADAPLRTFPAVIDELADHHGDRVALISERETFSFRDLADRANRYARWAIAHDIAPGQTVCLAMPNRPEYLAIWLGITKVGGVVALLNTNLEGAALAHCIKAAGATRVIVAAELAAALAGALPYLDEAPAVFLHGLADVPYPRIDGAIEALSGAQLEAHEARPPQLGDRALCIYTSGTTGLPKAANVSHHRVMMWAHWFAGLMNTGEDDRMYDCLPMYHSVGGVVAIGSALVGGGSVLIREKFSASRFWDDLTTHDCTLFQYIGELCRYLLNGAAHPRESTHTLRLVCGNGLRPDIWDAFKARFAIPRVLEFYAATEGNFSLYNVEGRTGAIGRIPSFLAHRFSAAIVAFDQDAGVPVRNQEGFCVRCARDQPGEAIGRIEAGAHQFEGYTSKADTEKKILRDVFVAGDAWVRTGDLMRLDRQGYFFFVDRIGDTFRWKGENVSTTEVAEALSACRGVTEAIVYGVAVSGHDGKAGMAAVVTDDTFTVKRLWADLEGRLPDYAWPVFVRLSAELAVTETFKRKKQSSIEAGFDPRASSEPLLFRHAAERAYVPLDAALFERIQNGTIRL